MPQVAQQDYIKNVTIADPDAVTESEITAIKELVERGTIWDAILDVAGSLCRVITLTDDSIYLYYVPDGEVKQILYVEY